MQIKETTYAVAPEIEDLKKEYPQLQWMRQSDLFEKQMNGAFHVISMTEQMQPADGSIYFLVKVHVREEISTREEISRG
jgi:hypothetical protein